MILCIDDVGTTNLFTLVTIDNFKCMSSKNPYKAISIDRNLLVLNSGDIILLFGFTVPTHEITLQFDVSFGLT